MMYVRPEMMRWVRTRNGARAAEGWRRWGVRGGEEAGSGIMAIPWAVSDL